MTQFHHIPIMLKEVLELLAPERGGIFVDGTLGGGGHSEGILKRLTDGRLYGIDRDGEAIAAASERLKPFGDKFKAIRGNFFDMKSLLANEGVTGVEGILLDLGVSSYQLDTPERGFSYHEEAPLDMRMDDRASLSAYDVVNGYSHGELTRIIRDYGEERYAAKVASAIVREREREPINSTTKLADIIKYAIPAANRSGVMAVITFHSLEDRIVKQAFKIFEHPCTCDPKAPICTCGKKPTAEILTKKPIVPGADELEYNPRSRSSKLRAIKKL